MLLVMEGDIMGASNFDQATISGKNAAFQQAVDALRKRFRFDFVSMGITASVSYTHLTLPTILRV